MSKTENVVHNPIFVDDLPAIEVVAGRKPERYRLLRDQALIYLLLDPDVVWHERAACPACGAKAHSGHGFSMAPLHFTRCRVCNSIYANKIPDEVVLERQRLALTQFAGPDHPLPVPSSAEFVSILNWMRLTEARYGQPLERVMDYRFCSGAPGWQEAAVGLSKRRAWSFVPLRCESEPHGSLVGQLAENPPAAVLVMAEMDRVADPAALLRTIKERTAPGTLVFVASSCADGLEYELLGGQSPSFVALDRLTMFSTGGFTLLARKLGFTLLELSTPGRLDAVILRDYFRKSDHSLLPFWSRFFRNADKDQLQDMQILLQRSLNSGVMRCVLQT
jgi:hypothetical protein